MTDNITAVVLCGGQGTRLKSVVGDLPKCLAPIAGKPFLCYLLGQLHRQGVCRAILCTGHGADQVEGYFGSDYLAPSYFGSSDSTGMLLYFPRETEPLGTGGAVLNALPLLDSDPFLVLNGDTLCRFNLGNLLKLYDENRAMYVGLSGIDVAKKEPAWTNTGVRLMSRAAIGIASHGATRDCKVFSLDGLFPAALAKNACYALWDSARFLDIGTPESYALAEKFLKEEWLTERGNG